MLLTIDIGNTNITMGLYEGETLGNRWRLATDNERMPDEYGLQILGMLEHSGCSPDQLSGICLASVVPPLTGRITKACNLYLGKTPLIIDEEVETGINVLYNPPSAVGADRIVDAVTVKNMYGGPACIVDFGTATTFDAITAEGGLFRRRDCTGHRHRSRRFIPAHSQTSQGRNKTPPISDWHQYHPRDPGGPSVWICLAGGRHGRQIQK